MTTRTYKGYTIRITGLSHYITRPGYHLKNEYAPGYAQSFAEAKRWINQDIKERLLENNRYYA